jgi:DnaJ-class molecular chaperone
MRKKVDIRGEPLTRKMLAATKAYMETKCPLCQGSGYLYAPAVHKCWMEQGIVICAWSRCPHCQGE